MSTFIQLNILNFDSVLIKAVKYRNTSDEVQFDLVKKKCNTAIVTRSECTNEHFPHLFGDGLIYSKVIIANVSEVRSIYYITNIYILLVLFILFFFRFCR